MGCVQLPRFWDSIQGGGIPPAEGSILESTECAHEHKSSPVE